MDIRLNMPCNTNQTTLSLCFWRKSFRRFSWYQVVAQKGGIPFLPGRISVFPSAMDGFYGSVMSSVTLIVKSYDAENS